MEKLTKGHDGKANDRRGFHGNYAVKSAWVLPNRFLSLSVFLFSSIVQLLFIIYTDKLIFTEDKWTFLHKEEFCCSFLVVLK